MSKAQKLTGCVKHNEGGGTLSSISYHLSSNKKGSALLIVLGMFAFMLVSAVAFSVYMRASRAPSSYLRRNTSLRQVVKAAVARAIDEVDTAIGNDPFPGVGYNHNYGGTGENDPNTFKNDNWHGRVFVPSNEVAMADTVSTLTLEGLGYLPPCLVNEVRYWSRHTRTAKWHAFNYGLGRYAFTAVNVSDFFDLNNFITPKNGSPRQYLNRSSAPHGRVSPTYLFRGDEKDNMDAHGNDAAAFLKALADGSGAGGGSYPTLSAVPFVSMLDFNLVVANAGNSFGGFGSPFVNLIQNNNTATFLSGYEDVARHSIFMVGGWNGGDSNGNTYQGYSQMYNGLKVNLNFPEFQPFSGYSSWFPEKTTLDHCYNDVSENHPFWKPYNSTFPIIATAMLCDYLDYDNVPLSLCIPCTEAVPMLCGVDMTANTVNYKIILNKTTQAADDENGTPETITYEYSLEFEVGDLEVPVAVVYPFSTANHGSPKEYVVEGFARVFFTADSGNAWGKGLRTSSADMSLGDNFAWDVKDIDNNPAFIQFKLDSSKGFSFPDNLNDEKFALKVDLACNHQGTIKKSGLLAKLVYEKDKDGHLTLKTSENGDVFRFYGENWESVDFKNEFHVHREGEADAEIKFRPSIAVYLRIKASVAEAEDLNKTIDMVPAIANYDSLNQQSTKGLNGFSVAAGDNAGTPLLRFFPETVEASGIRLGYSYFDQHKDASFDAKDFIHDSYLANDPRINWAPEQWWASKGHPNDDDEFKIWWLTKVKTDFQNKIDSRDRGIFTTMASNQGYMQSMYEWMMIPQVRELNVSGNPEWGAFEGGGGYDGVVKTAIDSVSYANVMWRTYRSDAFGYDNAWGSIDDLAFNDSDNGLRVNPYTDITNIMFGAFANMPRDWWSASTNYNASGKGYMNPSSTSFEKQYLFDWSCNYEDVLSMTRFWRYIFREKSVDGLYKSTDIPDRWTERFDGFSDGTIEQITDNNGLVRWEYQGGIRLFNWLTGEIEGNCKTTENRGAEAQAILQNELTLAERKFLYGYLKGCFANTAQLFLVFVRAETTAGGAVGAGARAVALVWRDPAAPSNGGLPQTGVGKDNARWYLRPTTKNEESWRFRKRDYPPHRTRILFYHQFD